MFGITKSITILHPDKTIRIMKVQIFLEDKSQDLWRGKLLATIEVEPITGYADREIVNNAIKPVKNWLMGIYNQTLIVSII